MSTHFDSTQHGSTQFDSRHFGLRGLTELLETGGVWIAHATGHLWNASPVLTVWKAVCAIFRWDSDDNC